MTILSCYSDYKIPYKRHLENIYIFTIWGLVLAHLIGISLLWSPTRIFSTQPILDNDYSIHYYHVNAVYHAFNSFGHFWSYDPSFCAGYPAATLYDSSCKLYEVLSVFLAKLGFPLGTAFNFSFFLTFAIIPLLLLGICRNFELSKSQTILAVACGTFMWHADHYAKVFIHYGMAAFVFASYWSVLVISIFYKAIKARSFLFFLLFSLSLAIAILAHILSVFMLLFPLGLLYIKFYRDLDHKTHIILLLSASLSLIINAWWLFPMQKFWHYHEAQQYYWNIPPGFLNKSVVLYLGVLGIFMLRRQRPVLFSLLIVTTIYFTIIGFLGFYLPVFSGIEAVRFVLLQRLYLSFGFMILLDSVLAKISLEKKWEKAHLFTLPAIAVCALLVFMPPALSGKTIDNTASLVSEFTPLVKWLENNTSNEARIACMDTRLGLSGRMLRNYVHRQFVGGPFREIYLRHNIVNFNLHRFIFHDIESMTKKDFLKSCELFNIGWVISFNDKLDEIFSSFTPEVQKSFSLETSKPWRDVNVFCVSANKSYFLTGAGTVKASRNRIAVSNALPGEVVLKYNWLETLAVDPELTLDKYYYGVEGLYFIKVINDDITNFVIYNRY